MGAMLVAESYRASLWSVPPAIAFAALLVVIAYAASVRGSPKLKGWLLLHCCCLVPYTLTMVLAASVTSEQLAAVWFRISAATVPLAAAAALEFRYALLGRPSKTRRVVTLVPSVLMLVLCASTPWFVQGATYSRFGFWFATPGPAAPLWFIVAVVIAAGGQLRFSQALREAGGQARRRQLRRTWIAHGVTSLGLLDILAAYYEGWFPIGWALVGIGSALLLRALVVEDLFGARAIDTRAPQAVVHVAGALLLGWAVLELLAGAPWWAQAIALFGAFSSIQLAIAVATLITRGARIAQGTRERFLSELAVRFREVDSVEQMEQLLPSVSRIGLGAAATLLVPSGTDWSWSSGGKRLTDGDTPDPLLVSWLAGQSALAAGDPAISVPAELRPSLDALFAAHRAQLLVPLRARDELLGLFVVGGERPITGLRRHLATLVAERAAEALSYLRMVRQVREREALARDVELAAQIQATYMPTLARRQLGRVRLVGAWQPATECGGDFWAAYDLTPDRALVVVGDVTGHGMPAALVTAAVRGACDVTVRAFGAQLALPPLVENLDIAVRRVGAERLHMSCVAAIVDARAGEVSFVNAGHVTPYLVRAAAAGQEGELEALVARGHPLGAGHPPSTKVARKAFGEGDFLLWYTDGLPDVANATGEKLGDRRLQRMLRGLAVERDAELVTRRLLDAVALHRGGGPLDDDVTVVVASLQAEGAEVQRPRSGEITVARPKRPG